MKLSAIASLCVLCACGGSGDERSFEQVELRLFGEAGETHLELVAQIAESATQRATGLAEHETLGPGEGMLLVFPGEARACITNRPVSFGIDVIYIGSDRRVLAVERSLPAGDSQVFCHDSTELVLEVAASVASDVQLGDVLVGR